MFCKRGSPSSSHLHPELARACHSGASHLHEEEVLGVAAAADVHQLQHHRSSVRVQLDEVDRLLRQAEAVDAHQILGLAQALGPHLHLPDLFEGRSGVWDPVVSQSSV